MVPKYNVIFLMEAMDFLEKLDEKTREKVIYNIDKSRYINDPKLFKKLNAEIWEFRTRFNKIQVRLLAFWDKEDGEETLVVSTHGIIKKTDKVAKKEIAKAEKIRQMYFADKNK
ncbi:type II toxin-antitoxin system RelE/ParE family toxin [Flavilitoribacter nigricans]|uniref:Addiction module toxin RelE n=1 Tax=Flavilitoribacter nigricans (strain ATCC 23147 / DSM 23189 / NBRC 102662 / NCIMB 1420 / SS-2) TaxID=1122177 RepID=A0A2D0N4U9_FLAN2|nr:type II toxin-antitoxin system RelE/ParE family toxin [Flavilitoribacter nigricans]PHN03525.1 addiction module toxin RelE [Flavilitoribacter nigricans DSM 23189 = NBRC 102662]